MWGLGFPSDSGCVHKSFSSLGRHMTGHTPHPLVALGAQLLRCGQGGIQESRDGPVAANSSS